MTFMAMSTKGLHWFLFRDSSLQFIASLLAFSKYILILSSHLRLGLSSRLTLKFSNQEFICVSSFSIFHALLSRLAVSSLPCCMADTNFASPHCEFCFYFAGRYNCNRWVRILDVAGSKFYRLTGASRQVFRCLPQFLRTDSEVVYCNRPPQSPANPHPFAIR